MSDAPSYFTDRAHMLLSGVSGSRTRYGGKTSLATWWADNWGRGAFDVVIFGNFKADDAPAAHADVDVGTVEAVADAMAEGHQLISLTPTSADWEAVSRRLQEFVQALPRDVEKLVVLDEAPELDEEALQTFVRVLGNGANCKTLVIAQAPGDLPTSIRRQTVLVWVGPATEQNAHVFDANGYSNHFAHIRDSHAPYQWTVITGPGDADRDTYDPVPEGYA